MFVIMPLILAVFGFLLMRALIFDNSDEAFDCGDHIVLRFGKVNKSILIRDIAKISYNTFTNPQRVTLSVRTQSKNLTAFSFAAPTVWIPFSRHPLILDLIARVDELNGR